MDLHTTPSPPGRRRFRRWLTGGILFVGLGALWACATGGSESRPGTDFNRITSEELEATRAVNVYELVERERPRWLVSRGARSFHLDTEIIVAVNRRYYGPVETLRQFKPEEVREIVYLDGPTATATVNGLGSRHVEAAIALEMRRH